MRVNCSYVISRTLADVIVECFHECHVICWGISFQYNLVISADFGRFQNISFCTMRYIFLALRKHAYSNI